MTHACGSKLHSLIHLALKLFNDRRFTYYYLQYCWTSLNILDRVALEFFRLDGRNL